MLAAHHPAGIHACMTDESCHSSAPGSVGGLLIETSAMHMMGEHEHHKGMYIKVDIIITNTSKPTNGQYIDLTRELQ